MFKIGLLTSTAMTAVALLLSEHRGHTQTNMHAASRDPNVRFLCTYGQFLVSDSAFSESGYGFHSAWRHVAVPTIGHGQTVTRIRVIEAASSREYSADFKIGLYKDSGGRPGDPIFIRQVSYAGISCGPVEVSIPPTKLKRNTTYWVEETTSEQFSGSASSVYWIAKPDAKRKAYVQIHRHTLCSSSVPNCHNSSYTSTWTKQPSGPYFKLK